MQIPSHVLEQIKNNDEVNSVPAEPIEELTKIAPTDLERNSYKIVSLVAYLLGVPDQYFSVQEGRISKYIFETLQQDEPAHIVRELCRLRSEMLRHFKEFNDQIRLEYRSLTAILPEASVLYLHQRGLTITDEKKNLAENILLINTLIRDRINNCKKLFPAWVKWEYMRDIFIMPAKNTSEEKAEAEKYALNRMKYPFQIYMHWTPSDQGNVLVNDFRFMSLIYEWHNDYLPHANLVSDAGAYTKDRIYDFVEESYQTVIVVDCENSDPYKFLSALNSLSDLSHSNVAKIILYDDIHAAIGWRLLKHYTDIPIEYYLIERLKDEKSLADIKITAKICEEYYQNSVESFILVSSDSDFWGLITELPKARFLVLLEYLKDSKDIKEALDSRNFFHCYLDKFYSDNEELIRKSLELGVTNYLKEQSYMNVYDMIEQAERQARVILSEEEKKNFCKKISRRLQLDIDAEGNVQIELRK